MARPLRIAYPRLAGCRSRVTAALHMKSHPSRHASRRPLRTLRHGARGTRLLRRGLLSVSGEDLSKRRNPTARPEEPPFSGGVSKGARWGFMRKVGHGRMAYDQVSLSAWPLLSKKARSSMGAGCFGRI
jgi:hypothetical protein